MKVGRFGRDRKYAGQKVGERILKWALGYIKELSQKVGMRYVTVDSYPNKVKMYESFGFRKVFIK